MIIYLLAVFKNKFLTVKLFIFKPGMYVQIIVWMGGIHDINNMKHILLFDCGD